MDDEKEQQYEESMCPCKKKETGAGKGVNLVVDNDDERGRELRVESTVEKKEMMVRVC